MKVGDLMTRGVLSVKPEDTVRKAAELMLRFDVNGFPVLDHGKLVGMITQGDFLRRAETGTDRATPRLAEFFADPGKLADEYVHSHGRTVAEVMTRDVITVSDDASLDTAVELMLRHRVKRLPVVKGNAMVGMISRVDLMHAFLVAAQKDVASDSSDSVIRRQLIVELKDQAWVVEGAVKPTVNDGVVVLRGDVRDARERAAIRVAAENIAGVRRVVDELNELPPETR